MIVYRLAKQKYSNQISGIGAEINGGRWNNKGFRILYTSASRALCTTEIAVHTPLGIVPKDYYLQTIKLPNSEIFEISISQLNIDWRKFPHTTSTKLIGDHFIIEGTFLILKVPSAVVQDEFNYLVNPFHKLFSKVKLLKIEPFTFDKRLFVK